MENDNCVCFTDTKSTVPLAAMGSASEKQIKEDVGEGNNADNTSDISNMYRYIKDDLFTSEIYKVEIQNLPKYIGFNEVKKFLAKYCLNPHKIKLFGKQTFAFVTFKSEEERDKAMKVLHGVRWKNRNLSVRLAKPKADPIIKKRKREEEEGGEMKEQAAAKCPELSKNGREEPLSKQIADVVTPLWNISYEEQLAKKEQECEQVLLKLTREIGNNNRALLPWLFVQKEKYGGLCCSLEGVKASPLQTEYRNKCEFLIGIGPNQEDKTVGFRLGKYKGGTCAVVEPFDTIHIPAVTKKVVKAFQDYIRSTPYGVYSPETYEGHWKQLTVRTSRNGHIMAIAYFNPQKLNKEELMELQTSLAKYFMEGTGKDSGITSLYFVQEGQRKSPNREDLTLEHVAGDKYIYEDLLGLKFRISPHAFFQVNTQAAEVLYSAIQDWTQMNQETTVMDVCCGTGTIGISLAKKVKKVIGIELCQEAVEDAKVNAQLNELNNVEFHCGKAEDLVPYLVNFLALQNSVTIVDPPRAGLHSKVILAIRKAEHLKKLIYISCNPRAAMNNFLDLCRAPSNRVKGSCFRPVKAMAVDLFPHTMHCELLFFFERVARASGKPSEALQGSTEIPVVKLEAAKSEAAGSTEEDNVNLSKEGAATTGSSY
ncbi:tRNA (uracil-5-)-methyltransferase homolog A [Rhineura floridana]|uniref:tRNA (uracil-5-)-methyltransferase homolog A n=1 Tax=Rhineura floridana TaxID=261503 RepID=UPI002AC82823|nr:tRNA (uracil-5-)-methyltransferase homolog A [Rhineura floridana]XP_061458315.1 tRNA (uracil-5-)-methyltransferase homolog A [Rhineura floridana]XP_061458316.1 tRNA (uracil-5-)-methyltransferase homolog A [Rhineura floridana]